LSRAVSGKLPSVLRGRLRAAIGRNPSPSTLQSSSLRIGHRRCLEVQIILATSVGCRKNSCLICDFFPKETDFSTIANADVARGRAFAQRKDSYALPTRIRALIRIKWSTFQSS